MIFEQREIILHVYNIFTTNRRRQIVTIFNLNLPLKLFLIYLSSKTSCESIVNVTFFLNKTRDIILIVTWREID